MSVLFFVFLFISTGIICFFLLICIESKTHMTTPEYITFYWIFGGGGEVILLFLYSIIGDFLTYFIYLNEEKHLLIQKKIKYPQTKKKKGRKSMILLKVYTNLYQLFQYITNHKLYFFSYIIYCSFFVWFFSNFSFTVTLI